MRKVRCEITGGRKGMRKEDGKMSRGRKGMRKKEGKIRCKIILDT